MTVEIPLKLKYRTHVRSGQKSKHNDGHKKHAVGWAKHRIGGGKMNHIPYAMVLVDGKLRKRPAYEDEVPAFVRGKLIEQGYVFPVRPS